MNKKIIVRILAWASVVAVMVLIFCFSAQDATTSTGTSDEVIEHILKVTRSDFNKLAPMEKQNLIDDLSFYIRKLAHFSIYSLLGFLSCGAVFTHTKRKIHCSSVAMAISVAYAISDEIHQLFVPGRACRFSDVLIDTAGTILGISIFISGVYVISLLRARSCRKAAEK